MWAQRRRKQLHIRLTWSASTFATIALHARTNDVFPSRLSALTSRHEMVDTQLCNRLTLPAVLTRKVISGEKILTIEPYCRFGNLVVQIQANNTGQQNFAAGRPQKFVVGLAIHGVEFGDL